MFEGKTGPYIQYTGARINSLLNKAGITNFNELEDKWLINVNDKNQRAIAINFLKLQESYFTGYKSTSLSPVCNAIFDFASSFSKFYNDTRIISEPDEKLRNSYISISAFVLKALKQASNVLAFDIPEKM